jgi:hypothetical protein
LLSPSWLSFAFAISLQITLSHLEDQPLQSFAFNMALSTGSSFTSKTSIALIFSVMAAFAPLSNAAAPVVTLTSPANGNGYFSDFYVKLAFDQTVTTVSTSATLELKEGTTVKFSGACSATWIKDTVAGTSGVGRAALIYYTGTDLTKNTATVSWCPRTASRTQPEKGTRRRP